MIKHQLALAYELENNEVDKFIKIVRKYKNLKVDDFLIFYKDLSKENKIKIKKECSCVLKKIKKNAKFEIFSYLNKYQNIIFTNLNHIVTEQFIKTYSQYNFSLKSYNNKRFVEYNFKKLLNNYKMFLNSYDTSVIFITNKLKNYSKISKWCKFHSFIYSSFLRDEENGIIDIMLQKFNIKITNIEEDYPKEIQKINKNDVIQEENEDKIFSGELVSIIMSIYDREDYNDSINSILNQTYSNLEFIIIIEKSAKQERIYNNLLKIKDKRLKILKNKKKYGFAKSLNIGIDIAKGKYIARMDDDDISSLRRIEKEVKYLEKNPNIGIVGTYIKFFGNSNLTCELPVNYEDLKVTCLYKTPLFHPTIIFNMKLIDKADLKYNEGIFAEDYDLWSRLIDKYEINNIPEVLYYYRLGNQNNSTSNEIEMNKSHHQIMKYQLKKFFDLSLTFDELQLLSGRVDVLGFSKNKEEVCKRKIEVWNKIKQSNLNKKYCDEEIINKEIFKIKSYYNILKELEINNE